MRVLTHFSLENFRLFKEKTSFDLTPITILTGTNSSGKSSLIKAILLLKSNLEKNKSIEEIDFSIGDHNLNDFKNSLNYDSTSNKMYFTFSSYVSDLIGVHYIELGYILSMSDDSKGNLDSFTIFTPKGDVILSATKEYDDDGGNITYKIDVGYFIKNLDHEVLNTNIKKEIYDNPYERWVQKYWLNPNDELFHGRPDSHESEVYFNVLDELKNNGIRKQIGGTKDESKHFNQSILYGLSDLGKEVIEWLELNLNNKNADFKRTDFGEFFYEDFSRWILKESIKQIFHNFNSILHFSSIRSDSKKYYNKDDKELLSFFIQYENESSNFNQEIEEFIASQLRAFSLGDAIKIVPYKDFLAEVFVIRNGKKILLSDLGYGYTQILPIIMRIALIAHRTLRNDPFDFTLDDEPKRLVYDGSLFLLEEPESNLHPAYQSKIADMIAYASSKFKIRFIIETHSEYLIRNLQFLIAKGKILNSNQVTIYYFNKPGTDEAEDSLFRTIHVEPNGRMTVGFGSGFFDEAESIAFDLFMLNQNRQN